MARRRGTTQPSMVRDLAHTPALFPIYTDFPSPADPTFASGNRPISRPESDRFGFDYNAPPMAGEVPVRVAESAPPSARLALWTLIALAVVSPWPFGSAPSWA